MVEGCRAWLHGSGIASAVTVRLSLIPGPPGSPNRCPAELVGLGLSRVLGKPWLLFLEKTDWRAGFQESKYRPPSGSLHSWASLRWGRGAEPMVGEGSRPIFFL